MSSVPRPSGAGSLSSAPGTAETEAGLRSRLLLAAMMIGAGVLHG